MSEGIKRRRTSWLMGGAAVALLAQASSAQSSVGTTHLEIPPEPLDAALNDVGLATDSRVMFSKELVSSHMGPRLSGDYRPLDALKALLAGTDLRVEQNADKVFLITTVAAAAGTVRVAAATKPAQPPGVETVVVTAEKKTEDIQTVPIAVSAFTQKQLTERQIAGGPDLVKEVPNLTFSKTNFSGYNLEIRGIGTQAISVTTDPAVAVAFNGIPFIRNHFFEQEFYDLDNLEVLRGPQGTLYGRNATAGVVNVISAKPTDSYEAMLSADFGNYHNRRLEAMINIPVVGDKLDLRIAGEWTKRQGYSFNTITNQPIDGRDLWSGRASLGWKPASNVQTYLVWEHFSEDDDRLRSAKQLCKTAPIPAEVDGVPVPAGGSYGGAGHFLSQGCEDTSLYSPDAFQVPNGLSLAYYAPLAAASAPTRDNFDPYAETTQSTNLRHIESTINPTYRAKNDTLEWNTDWQINPTLTLTAQTGYNHDTLWSTEDYNRFDSAPGAFVCDTRGDCGPNAPHPNLILPDPNPQAPQGSGIFCDPQLGCSDRLVLEDLSQEHAWQLSEEFRLASNFSGPLNFSVGTNYLHYETEENYYVFINSLTLLSASQDPGLLGVPYVPGVWDNSGCLLGGKRTVSPFDLGTVLQCHYIDPNPIGSLDNQGHNYFLSQNPYVLNSYAGFSEVYYNLTDELKLTAGARWTIDQKRFTNIPSELLTRDYGYPVSGVVNQQWSVPTGRAVLNWTPKLDFTDQTLIYFSAAHGYKAGGANPPGALFPGIIGGGLGALGTPIHPLTFKPEYIEAFELGTKNTLLDGALTLNGDIFYYNYTGYQISEIVDRTAINNNFNAHVEGAELESSWEPLAGLKFSLAQGYENAVLGSRDQAIDLMDRTAGNPNWIVVKPSLTQASNCILPTYVVAAEIEGNVAVINSCNSAYAFNLDPVTGLPYVPNPTIEGIQGNSIPPGYIGFNPATAPNLGEGFAKKVGGNPLPNAPRFTTSFTAEYTMPVWDDWSATLHGDFYFQSSQWARVFKDPIDKINSYYTANVSLILNSANGWQVMGYVKNIANVTAITGTFLNSDDTGLTTNVFLTDPRLFGVRVTKRLDENDGFWGSEYSGADLITGLFSDTDNGKPPIWIELGGSFDALDDRMEAFAPAFLATYKPNGLKSPLFVQAPPHYGFDEEAKVSVQPDASDWIFSAGIRYGRTGVSRGQHQQFQNAGIYVAHFTIPTFGGVANGGPFTKYPAHHVKFADASAQQSESHTVLDFEAGKDVGLGAFGLQGSSVISGGLRVAQLTSQSSIYFNGQPDLRYPAGPITDFAEKYQFIFDTDIRFHNFTALAKERESFRGLGPKLDWKASTPIAGDEADGEINLDWGANLAVLFGRQKASGSHQTTVKSYHLSVFQACACSAPPSFKNPRPGYFNAPKHPAPPTPVFGNRLPFVPPTNQRTSTSLHNRTRFVAVPNVGAFLGLSMKYRNAKVSFGYRADDFFGAMDGGIDSRKTYNRGFNGPYARLSLGLGG